VSAISEPGQLDEVAAILSRRAGKVLSVARRHGHRRLVLGAWGCGVFRNDPVQVAEAFRDLLVKGRFEGHFEQVVFGILDRTAGAATRSTFERTFA
jgi:uncharacterized protein (TIGR02452 family)